MGVLASLYAMAVAAFAPRKQAATEIPCVWHIRSRTQGKHNPAGTKLARKAQEGKVGIR